MTTTRHSFVVKIYGYGVATISRLLETIGLFCRISSVLYGSFAKETYNFKEPSNRSHAIMRSGRVQQRACTRARAHAHTRTHANTHARACAHTRTNTYTQTQTNRHINTQRHKDIDTQRHRDTDIPQQRAHILSCIHILTHTHTHSTHTHTHTHTPHTHTHTHALWNVPDVASNKDVTIVLQCDAVYCSVLQCVAL